MLFGQLMARMSAAQPDNGAGAGCRASTQLNPVVLKARRAEEPPGNRDRGRLRSPTPPTPPYVRVRIRRFSNLGPGGLEVRNPFRQCWFHRSPGPFRASPYPNWASSTEVDWLVHDRS
jgi:hypothetical protein